MTIKIINESGIGGDTQLIDEETGENIGKKVPIYSISIDVDAGSVRTKAVIGLVSFQVVGDGVEWMLPGYGGVRAIETDDGRRIDFHRNKAPTVTVIGGADIGDEDGLGT